MGFRYRKSINLGGGFRVNISKSGIGYSWGVKGARITKTARGTTRGTVGIPGTGISYVKETRKKNNQRNTGYSNKPVNNGYDTDVLDSHSTEKVNVLEYQPAEYKSLLDTIKRVQNINLLSTILIWSFLFSAVPLFIFTGIAGIILKFYTHTKLAISMDYEFDEESKKSYENLNATWMSLNENKKFWQTISETQYQSGKMHGGAKKGVARIPARAISKIPYFIKPNINTFGLQLRKQQLFFLPDKLLIISGKKVGAINYDDITMELETTRFIESESIPNDAKIIGQTWLKVNKNGTPDKRYKDNRQVPICEYGKIVVESGSTLHVELMCSNIATIDKMRTYASQVFKK